MNRPDSPQTHELTSDQLLQLKSSDVCPCRAWKQSGTFFCFQCFIRLDPELRIQLSGTYGAPLAAACAAALAEMRERMQ